MLQNNQLRSEKEKLKEKLKTRSLQVKALSQKILDHREVAERNTKEIAAQQSHTEGLQELLQGLRITMQNWESHAHDHSQKATVVS